MLTSNPPNAVSRTGLFPFFCVPFFENKNMGTLVPSLDLYQTCSTWKSSALMGALFFAHTVDCFVDTSYSKIVGA